MTKLTFKPSLLVVIFVCLFSSCADKYAKPHYHEFNLTYSIDNNYHWRESICGHRIISNYEPHNYDILTNTSLKYVETKNDEMRTVEGRLYCLGCRDFIEKAKLTDIYDDQLTFRKIEVLEDNNPNHQKYEPMKGSFAVSSHVRKEDIIEDFDTIIINNNYDNCVIPDMYEGLPVNRILPHAFEQKHFTSLTLGKNIESIGESAFVGATFDNDLIIPSNVKDIGLDAFFGSNLKKITLNDAITEIKGGTFENCRQLEEITLNDNIWLIDVFAFASCEDLKKITFPKALEEFSPTAFTECYSLREIVVPRDNKKFTSDGNNILSKNKRILYMPMKLNNEEYIVPDSVESIAKCAFRYIAYDVKKITLNGNLRYIDKIALSFCWDVEELKIPKKVEYIGAGAFTNCIALKSLTLPKSVKYLGASLLHDCLNLRRLTYEGTMSDWKNIEKDPLLFDGSKISFIDCVDGTIHISEALNTDE
jgi:hypothetical protein